MPNCCYNGCKNDSRSSHKKYMKGITFHAFPKPKTQLEKCKRWIAACGRPNFLTLDRITKCRYLCSEHFVGGTGPTVDYPDPMTYDPIKYMIDPREQKSVNSSNECSQSQNSAILVKEEMVDSGLGECPESHVENFNMEKQQEEILPSANLDNFIIASSVVKDEPAINEIYGNQDKDNAEELPMNISEPHETLFLPNCQKEELSSVELDSNQKSTFATLEDLFSEFWQFQIAKYEPQLNWSITRSCSSNSLFVFSTLRPEDIGHITIEIDERLHVLIKVYGVLLNDEHNSVLSNIIPETLTTLEDLINLLRHLDYLKLCPGISDPRYKVFYEDLNGGHVSRFTNVIHSNTCHGLLKRSHNSERCLECGILRSNLVRRLKRYGQETGPEKKKENHRCKTKNQLHEVIRQKNKEMKKYRRQNRSLRLRIETLRKLKGGPNEKDVFSEISDDDDPFSSKENFLRILMKQQMDLLKKNKSRPAKWPESIIKWCSYIRAKSNSTYDAIREVMPLPSISTLSTYTSVLPSESGFTAEEMREETDIDLSSP